MVKGSQMSLPNDLALTRLECAVRSEPMLAKYALCPVLAWCWLRHALEGVLKTFPVQFFNKQK